MVVNKNLIRSRENLINTFYRVSFNKVKHVTGQALSGKVALTHSTNLEHPCNLVKGNSQPTALSSNNSLEQTSTIGRRAFPEVTSVSLGFAEGLIFDEFSSLHPIIVPITTTDELLRPDKSKV